MVYININKLKSGYKKLYGMTVHEAVTARKIKIAYRLIINEDRRYYNFTPGELQHTINVKKL